MEEQQQKRHLISSDDSLIHKIDVKELARLNKLKLSRVKQKKFLELYKEYRNRTKCANRIGVSYSAIRKTIDNDERFEEEVAEIDAGTCDAMEEAMVVVGTTPDTRAHQDRIRYLQAHRPEKYANKPETAIQVNISTEHGQISLNNLLDKPSNHPQDADFTILSSKKNKR